MYHPTTRLLTILELLQMHAVLGGAEIARRLEVEPRSVRRYIQMLQDMGMPIEAVRGPGGGYRLRPGFKLPPLLFTEAEATAIVLGLLGSSWLELGLPAMSTEGALAKVFRVLPLRARERLNAVSTHLVFSPHEQEERPDATLLISLSEAIQQRQRVALDYLAQPGQATRRTVEPYGLAAWWGRWYLVGYCCLREGYRVFRLDRVQQVQLLAESFERPEDFDGYAYMVEHLAKASAHWQIEVEFQAPLEVVQRKIPASYGTLTATPTGVRFEYQYGDLASTALYLMGLKLPFVIHRPPELRAALLNIAEQMRQVATAQARPVTSNE
jgi:predicted DNA-binding transcriptional regulator YafY